MTAPSIPPEKGLLKMNKLTLALKNCYGIKKLNFEFDFSQERTYAIYAPNGAMKSSLAQTFLDVANEGDSTDRIFPTRPYNRGITDENGDDLVKEQVFVVRPYDEEFHPTEKTSTLLVDNKRRKEYEELQIEIDRSKESLLKALKAQSNSKRDFEKEISLVIMSTDNDLEKALGRIEKEVMDAKETPFADVHYDKIFDDKILNFLRTNEAKAAIEGYVKRYNELLEASIYFKKGTFDYYNAATIAKSLASNGFFDAKHSVNLNAVERKEISTQKELEDVIAKEKEDIIKDKELRKQFNDMEKLINANTSLRGFQKYLSDNEAFLSQLANIQKFKQDVLIAYLKARIELYSELMSKYASVKERMKQIHDEAAKQESIWQEVIQKFNDRFVVPFKLFAKDEIGVRLGYVPMIELGFTYHDGGESAPLDESDLLKRLSMGEKKALYILNIIFEVSTRKKAGQETIMIIDDLADSFDYQNKYAIIQYLKDINEDRLFKQIIMTHNFDFFRTINSRTLVSRQHCLMASREAAGIILEPASGIITNVFKDLKATFFANPKKKIASIPFIRNLIELRKNGDDPGYTKLTSLLHWKADSAAITETQLDTIYNEMFGTTGASTNGTRAMVDIIHQEARSCLTAGAGINFENKIVLSIAIRIGAEQFMVEKINNAVFVDSITSNQTPKLLAKFKELFSGDSKAIKTLESVILMTPENIHLNSFMYEPIVDLSDGHLRTLYKEICALNAQTKTAVTA